MSPKFEAAFAAILELMFVLFFDNVKSERELMRMLSEQPSVRS